MARKKPQKKKAQGKAKQKSFIRHYTARELLKLLLIRHSDDVAVSECKIGPTQFQAAGRSARRFDMWVMKKSWANPSFIGYEIKVTRSDFLRDEKWREYLPYCSQFSFVCPPGIISKEEVPEEAGLIVCTANATKLFTKKKAPFRVIDLPVDVFQYILMSRTRIERANMYYQDRKVNWTEWMATRDENKELGYNVSKKIRELVDTRIKQAEQNVKRMEKEVKIYSLVKRWLKKNGIDHLSEWGIESNLTQRLEEHERGFTSSTQRVIQDTRNQLDVVLSVMFPEGEPEKRRKVARRTVKRREEVEGEEAPISELGKTVIVPTLQIERKK